MNTTARRLREDGTAYGPGRPAVHEEDWTKVTVVLLNRQIVYLDRLTADIREATGSAVKRAEIIRALVDALAESGIDLTATRSETEIKQRLMTHLRKDDANDGL